MRYILTLFLSIEHITPLHEQSNPFRCNHNNPCAIQRFLPTKTAWPEAMRPAEANQLLHPTSKTRGSVAQWHMPQGGYHFVTGRRYAWLPRTPNPTPSRPAPSQPC